MSMPIILLALYMSAYFIMPVEGGEDCDQTDLISACWGEQSPAHIVSFANECEDLRSAFEPIMQCYEEKKCCNAAINYYRSHVLPALAVSSLEECVDKLPGCGKITATCASVLDKCLEQPAPVSSVECEGEDEAACVCAREMEELEPVAECVGEKGCCNTYDAWCSTREDDYLHCEAECHDALSEGTTSILRYIAGIGGFLFVAGILGLIE